jgi:uncharacterized protein (DUF433 family)
MSAFDRITIHPEICLGQATIRGMRLTVSVVLKMMAAGQTKEDVLRAYPELELKDIEQALRYAAWLASEQTLPFPAA